VSKPHIKHYEQEDKKCIIEFEICPTCDEIENDK
jgi:hypothetical protein